jgi:hypothetical protein
MKPRCSSLLQTGFVTSLFLLTTAVVGLNDQSVLVSIYTDNLGLVTPEGKRLYAEIAKNGAMIYADRTEKGFVDRKRTLTDAELSKLRGALKNEQLSALKGAQLGRTGAHVDYVTGIVVNIMRDSGPQEFTLTLFDPSTGHDFPAGAKDLLCLVDETRASSYRLTRNCK